MLQQFLQQSAFAITLEVAVVIGVLSKIIIYLHYVKMVQETDQMKQLHTKWIMALKKRFDNYEQLHFKVNNAESFVDKYMEMDRICGWKAWRFEKIPYICMVIVLLCAVEGREDWLFMTGVNLTAVFAIQELLLNTRRYGKRVKTNLLLSIEKGTAKARNHEMPASHLNFRAKSELPKGEFASAKEGKEKLPKTSRGLKASKPSKSANVSQEEMESFGEIMKEWWEF